jgi:hypothetical protein
MKTQKVLYKDEEYDLELTVRQATVADGMERSVRLAQLHGSRATKAQDTAKLQENLKDRMHYLLLLQMYPACMAVTDIVSRGSIKVTAEMSPEEFMQLPDKLVVDWERVVFALNEHWVMRRSEESDEKGEGKEPSDATS